MAKIYIGTTLVSDDDGLKAEILGGAGDAFDTLSEIEQIIEDDQNLAGTLIAGLGNRLRIDTNAQALDATQLANARTNLGLGTAASAAAGDYATSAQGTLADNALAASAVSTFGATLIQDADAATARTTLGLDTLLSGKQDTLTFGIANTNAVKIDNTSAAANPGDICRFAGNGIMPITFQAIKYDLGLPVIEATLLDKANNASPEFTGNVGIGLSGAPSEALDVVGNIKASGSITGTLATAAQTAITSVGTLTGLTVQGDATFQSKPLMSDGLEIGSGDNLELDTNILFEKTTTDREIRITNSTAGDGGDLELIAGSAGGGNTDGGDISITGGSGAGTGANGKITIVSPTTAGSNAGDIELINDAVSIKTTSNGVELYRQLQIHYVGVYADNTAALSAGLTAGEVYRTSAGVLMITF
tara:strand:- start:1479 stop:2732 length:1254 start_codon:yes stop_codon:yes gene_type:complete